MPVGDPGTMLASLKNEVIDAAMAVEPTQTAAVQSLKFAKTVVDIEGGGGPSVFHPYAYNGVFVHSAFLKDHPDTARAHRRGDRRSLRGRQRSGAHERPDGCGGQSTSRAPTLRSQSVSDKVPRELRAGRDQEGVDNVSAMLLAAKTIEKAVPYEQLVATDFMPPEAGAPTR